MKGNDFNASLSIFYISYIIFQLPCNAFCKWIGPGWFIPATTLGFGVCSMGTAFVHNYPSLCGVRFLLGIFESAMQPSLAYYLSRWYKRDELTFRVSLYIVSASLAGAFGGLLASAILNLPSFGSLHSWRMIFAIEGTYWQQQWLYTTNVFRHRHVLPRPRYFCDLDGSSRFSNLADHRREAHRSS